MQPNQFAANEQPQSEARAAAVDRIGILVQAFENQGLRLRTDTPTGVAHRDINRVGIGLVERSFYSYRSFERCELDGVVDEIDEDFENAIRIGVDQRNALIDRHLNSNLLALRRG